MGTIKVIGIIAIIILVVAYLGEKVLTWFIEPSDTTDKIEDILGSVALAALVVGVACGLLCLLLR